MGDGRKPEPEEEREKPVGLQFALLFLASGDIDGAALTSWARGTVAVRLSGVFFIFFRELIALFFSFIGGW